MRVCVTGCCGFIGSNLTRTLLEQGREVVGIDKVFDPKRLPFYDGCEVHHDNINKITRKFEFIWLDLNELSQYGYIFDDIDIVYHLAAYTPIRDEEIHKNIHDTVDATFTLLDLIVNHNVPKLVFSSTSSIYGEQPKRPLKENEAPIKPISHYAAGKIANEAYIQSYAFKHGFKAWMFRFANVTGAGQNRGVIYDLLSKLKDNPDELLVLGNGKQIKSFFDVEDCVKGLIDIPLTDKNNNVELYNLGNTMTITIGELAKIVSDEAGLFPKIKYSGGDRGWIGDTPHTIIDISKVLETGWKPNYTCEQAIRRTVRWLLENEISLS